MKNENDNLPAAAASPQPCEGAIAAIVLYGEWADRTRDYPHDEQGCIAHDAIYAVYENLKGRRLKPAAGK